MPWGAAAAVIEPPSSVARSRIAVIPTPPGAPDGDPDPVVDDVDLDDDPGIVLSQHWAASACRTTLLTASVTMRYDGDFDGGRQLHPF